MRHTLLATWTLAVITLLGAQVHAEEKPEFKGDKTGTNPINFTFDARLYNEFIWLDTEGDGEQNITTFEYRRPLFEGKLQFRTRIRATWIEADVNGDGSNDLNKFGLGDVDIRFLAVPYVNMKRKVAVAVGLETFLPTPTDDALGSRRLSFGPQIFGVLFNPLGIKGTLIAPAYQHKFSVWENDDFEDLHQGLIDIFMLWASADKQRWALVNPQIVLDYEENIQFGFVDVEVGTMLDEFIERKGHSVYLRPSVGVGQDRPTEGSVEVGYKIVW